MRYLKLTWLCLALVTVPAGLAFGQYIPLEFDGHTIMGLPMLKPEPIARLAISVQGGGLTNVAWHRFSQATLQKLASYGRLNQYASPFLNNIPPQAPPEGPKITIKPVDRMERPASGGLFASPVMLLMFFLMYAANIYAGYEIAIYRQRNPMLVASLSALAPVIVPIIYISMRPMVSLDQMEEAQQEVTEAEAAPVEAAPVEEAAGAPVETAPAQPQFQATVYVRGQTTFNRRFFETKLAGFLKVVPGEAEKDLVLAISSARGAYVGRRLVRVSPNELTLLVVKGDASQEVMIPFNEINEVQVRHEDAPAGP
jgi:hypothetical protein